MFRDCKIRQSYLDHVVIMREHVDLTVTARGANAVEYKLRAPKRATSSWRAVVYFLWLVTAASASSWHAQEATSQRLTWLFVAGLAVVMACGLHITTGAVVVEESVLVVPTLGVQLSRRQRNGITTRRFIDVADISAVVVNEGFVFSDVVYYIAFMVHSKNEMVLAFEQFRPRITILQEIFVQMRQLLFPDESKIRLPHIGN